MAVRAVLDQINVVVKDMDAMVAFYDRLGVELRSGLAEWAGHHRSAQPGDGLDLDFDSEAFATVWNRGWPGGCGIVLGFRLASREDVDSLYAELVASGYAGQQEPYDAFWGSRYAVVADPDGNSVGLMSPTDPAFRSVPPPPPS